MRRLQRGSDQARPLGPWLYNLKAHPDELMMQDVLELLEAGVRELDDEERERWWPRG